MLFQSLLVAAVTTFQWMFWGFSLAYSRSAGPFIGDLKNFGMKNVSAAPSGGSPYIPDIGETTLSPVADDLVDRQ